MFLHSFLRFLFTAWDWSRVIDETSNSLSIDNQQFFISAHSGSAAVINKLDRDGNQVWRKQFAGPTGITQLVTISVVTFTGLAEKYDSINHIFNPGGAINKFDFQW